MNNRNAAPTALDSRGNSAVTGEDSFRELKGRRVVDQDGTEIGDVVELFAEQDTGRVRFLRVPIGGILGVGKTFTMIPVEAIVDVDKKRVLIDADPNRLNGIQTYFDLGQPRWDIPPETRVVTADGSTIGEMTEAHPGFIVVEKGVYFPHDLYIPNDAIANYDGQEVHLTSPKAEIGRQRWNEAPPALVRESS